MSAMAALVSSVSAGHARRCGRSSAATAYRHRLQLAILAGDESEFVAFVCGPMPRKALNKTSNNASNIMSNQKILAAANYLFLQAALVQCGAPHPLRGSVLTELSRIFIFSLRRNHRDPASPCRRIWRRTTARRSVKAIVTGSEERAFAARMWRCSIE
jgi:hypothetical protein